MLTNKVRLTARDIHQSHLLELIVVTASVAETIDLAEAEKRNIKIRTIRGYATDSVAQLTISLMLSLACRLHYYTNFVQSGRYSQQRHFAHVGDGFVGLAGKHLGVIGLGGIGTRDAEIAQHIGVNVVHFSTTGRNHNPRFPHVDFDELTKTLDIITIHTPRNTSTKNLIDRHLLEQMKRDALLINTGRGGIVNELDLATALLEGVIGGAVLDVFEHEPLPPDSPLLDPRLGEKLILTPHCAWAGDGTKTLLSKTIHEVIFDHILDTDPVAITRIECNRVRAINYGGRE